MCAIDFKTATNVRGIEWTAQSASGAKLHPTPITDVVPGAVAATRLKRRLRMMPYRDRPLGPSRFFDLPNVQTVEMGVENVKRQRRTMDLQAAKERIAVALLLTMAGGFLDAFTFIGHAKVFANSMTGNIVLLGIEVARDWVGVSRHALPLAGFACALLAGRLMRLATARRPSIAAVASLMIEIVFMVGAATTLRCGLWLIPGLAFAATLQATFFAQSAGVAYSNVMTTGNLRGALQSLFESSIPHRNVEGLRKACALGAISVSFALGAVVGAIVTPRLHDRALLVPAALLAAALLYILWRARQSESPREPPVSGSNAASARKLPVNARHEGMSSKATAKPAKPQWRAE